MCGSLATARMSEGAVRLQQCGERSPTAWMEDVVENGDLVALILRHANLDPASLVAVGRVCRLWHDVSVRDATLALAAARVAPRLTKSTLMGCLALTSAEADQLPRQVLPRGGGGFMYLYSRDVVGSAFDKFVGGAEQWRKRLVTRARRQKSLEIVFGPEWRTLQWPRRRVFPCIAAH